MKLKVLLILCCLLAGVTASTQSQEENSQALPSAVTELTAHAEFENNEQIAVMRWKLSGDDGQGKANVTEYVVFRGKSRAGPFEERGLVPAGRNFFKDILIEDSILIEPVTTAETVAPFPPTNVTAADKGSDHGHAIILNWELSADDGAGRDNVIGYAVYRADSVPDIFLYRGTAFKGTTSYEDRGDMNPEERDYMPDYFDYYYKVRALTNEYRPGAKDFYYVIRSATTDSAVFRDSEPVQFSGALYADSDVFGPVQSCGQWFNAGLKVVLVCVAIFLIFTVYFIRKARGGAKLYVRRLAGIEAVDEAIGRATEMGKPILYVLGLGTAADIATIASYTILGRVAKKVAEYQTGLIVPCYDPIVMTVAQETVKTAYMDAGRPDAFNEDMVYFVTNQQFAYVAGVNGIMLRELPATNLYMGKFYAESLILAETGAVAGSIQISGTDEISQIPFFVVACDYTLIGEELYAASAYLGKEPLLLGSLKAQDYAKAGVIILAIIGFITMISGWEGFRAFFHVVN